MVVNECLRRFHIKLHTCIFKVIKPPIVWEPSLQPLEVTQDIQLRHACAYKNLHPYLLYSQCWTACYSSNMPHTKKAHKYIYIYIYIYIHSGTSIYRSSNDRFPACTVRHFWSGMKFHINNVIYSRIHCSPNYRFTAVIVCKSRFRRSISRMNR